MGKIKELLQYCEEQGMIQYRDFVFPSFDDVITNDMSDIYIKEYIVPIKIEIYTEEMQAYFGRKFKTSLKTREGYTKLYNWLNEQKRLMAEDACR